MTVGMTRTAKPTIVSIIEGGRYRGCLMPRAGGAFEAYDSADRSIGMFADAKGAHAAVIAETQGAA